MAEIDYTIIAIISAVNTLVAIVVKECFDLFKDWRKRISEELTKKINGKNNNHQQNTIRDPERHSTHR